VHAIFGTKVADYVASRPDYPAALLAELRRRCPPPALAADVGAGTGLLTRDLLRSGYYVVAVEPNDEMRQACDHLLAGVPRCRSVPGSAESIPLPDGSVSLITAAQAFHWFDLERSRREFRRVLAPNGLVALIWNERIDTDPLHAALDRVLSHFGGEKWKLLGIQEQRAGVDAFFGQRPASHSWPHAHALDREGLRSLVFSRSYIPGRQTPADADVVQAVDEVFERFCPAGGSSVLVRYETILLIEQIR
jgi:SAM-dependent methyltransferase